MLREFAHEFDLHLLALMQCNLIVKLKIKRAGGKNSGKKMKILKINADKYSLSCCTH